MNGFSLHAHVLTRNRSISAQLQGARWVVSIGAERRTVSSLAQTLRVVRDYVGQFLGEARKDQLWGLVVHVDGFSALYGSPNPAAGVQLGGGLPADSQSPLARIYHRWRAGEPAERARERTRHHPRGDAAWRPRGGLMGGSAVRSCPCVGTGVRPDRVPASAVPGAETSYSGGILAR